MTLTPRVDALIEKIPSTMDSVRDARAMQDMCDLARTLERELTAMTARCEKAELNHLGACEQITDLERELAESRRANAHLRTAVKRYFSAREERGHEGAIEQSRAKSDLDNALSATSAEQKAWEDALWGEPVAIIKVDVRKPEWPTNLHWILQLIDISMLPAETSLYAKPKGLK